MMRTRWLVACVVVVLAGSGLAAGAASPAPGAFSCSPASGHLGGSALLQPHTPPPAGRGTPPHGAARDRAARPCGAARRPGPGNPGHRLLPRFPAALPAALGWVRFSSRSDELFTHPGEKAR